MRRFYHPNKLKSSGSSGADIVINPVRLHSKFPTLMSKLGNQLIPLLERQSDEAALQLLAGLLFLPLGSFHERKRSCRRGWNGHIVILIFLLTLAGGLLVSFFFTEPIAPSFSNEVNPNLVGCCFHIVQEIKAHVECVKLVYFYYVTFLLLQTNTCHLTLLASFSPCVYSVN